MGKRQEAAEAFERAADLFESGRLGWIQNKLRIRNEFGKITDACFVGGLAAALYGLSYKMVSPAEIDIDLAHEIGLAMSGFSPATWNDTPGRTKAEVIDKLKEFAKELRNSADPS